MKVLVTGATGFIGYHVTHFLLQNNHEVIATATSVEKAAQKDWFSRVKFIEHTIGEEKGNENLFQKFDSPDILIHLAWPGLPDYKGLFHVEKTLPAQYSFLEKMVIGGLKSLTVTGTCFEYGMKNGCLSETMQPEPANPYAEAKDSLRKQLEALQLIWPYSLKWVRLFYMYGKEQNPKSLLAQLDKALLNKSSVFNMSGGKQVRDYLPVEKVAEYIVGVAIQNQVTGIINCCSNIPVTVENVVKDHLKKRGKSIQLNQGFYPYPDYEPMEFWGDNRKMKAALNDKIQNKK